MAKTVPIDLADDRPPYDRQPAEPDKSWFAFHVYRDLPGARALRPVAEIYKKKFGIKGAVQGIADYLSRQSVRWRWKERCAEWDRMIDTRLRGRRLRAMEGMVTRHLELAREAGQTAMIGLEAIKRAAKEATARGEEHLSVKDVLGLATFGVTQERIIHGEPTAIEETRVSVEDKRKALQSVASDPDLLDALLEKIGAGGDANANEEGGDGD